jgi:hypothetical protein
MLHCAAFLLPLDVDLICCRMNAAKKEMFELEDKFEAAKFEKEILLQVCGFCEDLGFKGGCKTSH